MSYIDSVNVGGTSYKIQETMYIAPSLSGTAYTASLTNFTLAAGTIVQAKFTTTNPANATLNVNSTGAKDIYYNNAKITAGQLKANHTYTLVYDGTQWQLVGDIDTNTWNALSTSQAGYVSQAPNDTTKFLRGDASWAVLPAASSSVAGITKVGASGGAAAYSHNHDASDINAGTLNTNRLPDDVVKKRTGLSTSTTETDLFSLIPGMYDHTSSGVDNALPTGYGTILNIAGSYYYGALIAAETNNSLYYRAYYYQDDEHEQWRGNWQMVAHADAGSAKGSSTKPIYINARGEIQEGTALKDLAYIAKPGVNTTTTFLRGDGTWQTALTSHQSLAAYAPLASPALTGTPTAPTATNGTSTTQIATTEFVNNTLSYVNAMRFKGTLGTGGTVTALPASHEAGDTYRVITADTWAGKYCEVGTLIICTTDGTAANDAHWTSVETNEDGAVIGPESSTNNAIARFDGATGRIIQNSGITIDDNGNLVIAHTTSATMTTASTNPQIIFSENGSQPVHLIYSDYNSYRSPAGLKIIGGSSASPAWLEVEGNIYAAAFKGHADSATSANYINLYETRGATTTLNKVANYIGAGKMFHLVASSSTDTTDNGKTPTDANILQMNWDNNGGYDAQLGIATGVNRMYFRSRPSQKVAWDEVAHAPVGTTGVGNANQPVYMTSEGVITAITAVGATYGGTGKTTLKDSANALINALDTGSSDLTANDYVITQYVGGGTTTTTYHRRPASKVVNATLVKAALGTVGTTAKKFLKDTGNWVQVDWEDLTGKPTTETLRDTLFPVTTYTKTVTLTTEWQDVGITGADLNLDGTYIIQLYLYHTGTNTLGSYSERYSGIMSWYKSITNSGNADEIVLHRAGHAPNNNCIYLRVKRSSASATPNTLLIQIKASKDTTVEATLKFKFRWILD